MKISPHYKLKLIDPHKELIWKETGPNTLSMDIGLIYGRNIFNLTIWVINDSWFEINLSPASLKIEYMPWDICLGI